MVQVHGVSTQEELQKRIYQIMKDVRSSQSGGVSSQRVQCNAYRSQNYSRGVH